MKVRGYLGYTDAELEYYGEAEPRLLQLREMYREGKVTRDQVIDAVRKLVGDVAVQRDQSQFEDLGLFAFMTAFEKWQAENPLAVRLYGSPKIVAALVLAPPDATEVEYVREA
jgi:hypothetical protein